jgi:hypothetical protein
MSIKCESCKWYDNFRQNFQYCSFFDARTKGDRSAKDCKEFKQFKMKPNKRLTKIK